MLLISYSSLQIRKKKKDLPAVLYLGSLNSGVAESDSLGPGNCIVFSVLHLGAPGPHGQWGGRDTEAKLGNESTRTQKPPPVSVAAFHSCWLQVCHAPVSGGCTLLGSSKR